MIRVCFVFSDPLDDSGINLSYIDVPTQDPAEALRRVEQAAESGELWENMYPGEDNQGYELMKDKMLYFEIPDLKYQAELTLLTL